MEIADIKKKMLVLQKSAFGNAIPTDIPRSACDPAQPLESQPISCLVEIGKQKDMQVEEILFALGNTVFEDKWPYDEEGNSDPIGTFPGSALQHDYDTEVIIDKFKKDYPVQNKRWMETTSALVREQLKPYKSLAEQLLR